LFSLLCVTGPPSCVGSRDKQALKDEFDQLYDEGAARRRMMVVTLHDRISDNANRARVLDRFLGYPE
jgi:peptidoglycan/xylan/chitin deacetylase (PgdA/CDA1 family)